MPVQRGSVAELKAVQRLGLAEPRNTIFKDTKEEVYDLLISQTLNGAEIGRSVC
jgi:hypothetical protein